MNHQGLNCQAIAVPETEAALKLRCDTLGFTVLYRQDLNGGTIRLTHLGLGDPQLQFMQPLTPEYSLPVRLAKSGPGPRHLRIKL